MCGSLCACGTTSESPRILNSRDHRGGEGERCRGRPDAPAGRGAPVDARGSGEGSDEGYTALLYAVEHRFLPLTRLLLRSGARFQRFPAGHQNVFPLLKAASEGKRDMLVLLLDYGAKINQKRPGDGMDALAIACLAGHLTICGHARGPERCGRTAGPRLRVSAPGTSRSSSGCWTPARIRRGPSTAARWARSPANHQAGRAENVEPLLQHGGAPDPESHAERRSRRTLTRKRSASRTRANRGVMNPAYRTRPLSDSSRAGDVVCHSPISESPR